MTEISLVLFFGGIGVFFSSFHPAVLSVSLLVCGVGVLGILLMNFLGSWFSIIFAMAYIGGVLVLFVYSSFVINKELSVGKVGVPLLILFLVLYDGGFLAIESFFTVYLDPLFLFLITFVLLSFIFICRRFLKGWGVHLRWVF